MSTFFLNDSVFLCKKSWYDRKCVYDERWQKFTKHVVEKKSFSVFRGAPSNTLKLFLAKILIYFCQRSWKIQGLFYPKIRLYCPKSWHFTLKYFKICVTKKFFLMTIQKHGFWTWKTQKSQKNLKCPSTKFSWVI